MKKCFQVVLDYVGVYCLHSSRCSCAYLYFFSDLRNFSEHGNVAVLSSTGCYKSKNTILIQFLQTMKLSNERVVLVSVSHLCTITQMYCRILRMRTVTKKSVFHYFHVQSHVNVTFVKNFCHRCHYCLTNSTDLAMVSKHCIIFGSAEQMRKAVNYVHA